MGLIPFIGVEKNKIEGMQGGVCAALDDGRPNLQADEGDVELVEVAGACVICPMAQMTLKMGIEKYLKGKIPEVVKVVAL